jgi:aryl-alcohol dehydrogenase-like predicted oxidoreductase
MMEADHKLEQPIRSGCQDGPTFTLGAANFGTRWGPSWAVDRNYAARLLCQSADLGVKAINTANIYNGGESEAILGELLTHNRLRDRFTISTKFGYRTQAASAGGSGAKVMAEAVERSLRRLRTGTIDLLYLHLWDRKTSIEETLEAAGDLVRQGKIKRFGLSNVPAWYVARADALCSPNGLREISAIQLQYNLLMRNVENDYFDVLDLVKCQFVAWGPLADGLLSGKYNIDSKHHRILGEGRLTYSSINTSTANPYDRRVISIIELLQTLSGETGYPAAQIALAWMLGRPHLSSIVIGVTSLEQLNLNLGASTLKLDSSILARLDEVSKVEVSYPQSYLEPDIQALVHSTPD